MRAGNSSGATTALSTYERVDVTRIHVVSQTKAYIQTKPYSKTRSVNKRVKYNQSRRRLSCVYTPCVYGPSSTCQQWNSTNQLRNRQAHREDRDGTHI